MEFERNHQLISLLKLCSPLDSEFKKLKRDLEKTNRYAVVVRYPGVIIKVNTAEAAFTSAKRVRSFVRAKLGMK